MNPPDLLYRLWLLFGHSNNERCETLRDHEIERLTQYLDLLEVVNERSHPATLLPFTICVQPVDEVYDRTVAVCPSCRTQPCCLFAKVP